jgi:hypothetical protein
MYTFVVSVACSGPAMTFMVPWTLKTRNLTLNPFWYKYMGMTRNQLERKAQDRDAWRSLVEGGM